MRVPFAAPIILLLFHSLAWAAEPDVIPHLDSNDPVALREAIRLLDEEVKLAARPQTYVVIDLVTNAVIIKGRGVELHRLPIEQWTASQLEDITSTFRLRERPPVSRRKIEPAGGSQQSPISLDDMPTDFSLSFSPPLTVTIEPFAPDNPWRWVAFKGHEWWLWLKGPFLAMVSGNTVPSTPSLRLTLTHDHAQSLAWTVTEGMPFLIRRTSPQ
ncbi:MAG TPA: hypothetical protein VF819_08305 [Nitrospira sp.]